MRKELIERVTTQITRTLSSCLRSEGINLVIAANDNISADNLHVVLEAIEEIHLSGSKPLTQFNIILSILGKNWQDETLIEGVFQCLYEHQLSIPEIAVLLMRINVETVARLRPRQKYRRAIMRYVLEEETLE